MQSDSNSSKLEIFPKEKLSAFSIYWVLLIFGSFGIHQFLMRMWKKGLYLLFTCGISHGLLIISLQHYNIQIPVKVLFYLIFGGYFLGVPVLFYDLFTLPIQVKSFNKKLLSIGELSGRE